MIYTFKSKVNIHKYDGKKVWAAIASAVGSDLDKICLNAFGVEIEPPRPAQDSANQTYKFKDKARAISIKSRMSIILGESHAVKNSQHSIKINGVDYYIENNSVVMDDERYVLSRVSYPPDKEPKKLLNTLREYHGKNVTENKLESDVKE